MTITTGTPVRSGVAKAEEGALPDDMLFSPRRPGTLSNVFDVDASGVQLVAAGIGEGVEIQLEMFVGDTPTPVWLEGKRQLLLHNHNILPITHPGRYRLRVTGGASSSGLASVQIHHLRRYS